VTDRVYDRVPLSIEVEYRTAGAFLVAYTSNLSKGGLFIETEKPLLVGTQLVLRFTIPDVGPIEVQGSVAWVRPEAMEGKSPGMGVEFEHLDARHGQVIDDIVGSFIGLEILVFAGGFQARAQLGRSVRSVLSSADVVEASTSDGADSALRGAPDLVIIDLDVADSSEGLYLLRRSKIGSDRQIPAIVIARDELIRERAKDLGADEILPAPLAVADLQTAILRALGRPLRVG
jgi:uncharacterized protein (TIGR02266 family)